VIIVGIGVMTKPDFDTWLKSLLEGSPNYQHLNIALEAMYDLILSLQMEIEELKK